MVDRIPSRDGYLNVFNQIKLSMELNSREP